MDTKDWKDVTIHGDWIHSDQEDVTDDILAVADLAYAAEGDLAEVGLPPGELPPVVVLAGRQGIDERIGPVRIVGERDVLTHIARYVTRLTPAKVYVVLARATSLFPSRCCPNRQALGDLHGGVITELACHPAERSEGLLGQPLGDASCFERGVGQLYICE